MRVAVVAKQVPRFEELRLGRDGRLRRDGLDVEINPYCRRAIAKGVELARDTGGGCTVFTLGPPAAEEVLREAVAWGADEGVLVTDPAFAGSDTLATAVALAAAIRHEGPYDLVLAGLSSVDSDTGQVGAQLAELLDLPMLGGVREMSLDGRVVRARCERDDGHAVAHTGLPTVLTTAERLCAPAKVPPEDRTVPAERIRTLSAADLGAGPWGAAASPTAVGEVRPVDPGRRRFRPRGTVAAQVRAAVEMIVEAGALDGARAARGTVPATGGDGPYVAVVAEEAGSREAVELLGAAARLAHGLGGRTAVLSPSVPGPAAAWAYGADETVSIAAEPGDAAATVDAWARDARPWAILMPSTSWGREVAGRASARLAAGLTGDAVDLEVRDGRLVCWKAAFGGQTTVAVTATSPTQMATVRPGMLPAPAPRRGGAAGHRAVAVRARARVSTVERVRDGDPGELSVARVVVGIGQGVDPERYAELMPLLDLLGAELAATRKVTDRGLLPRSRQVGITGRAVAPRLYVAVACSGRFNHMVGVRGAGFVLAVNADPDAPVFEAADAGIVADWAECVPLLVDELRDRLAEAGARRGTAVP